MSNFKKFVVALAAIVMLSTGAIVSAQTSTTTPDTPGVPNTGTGDPSANWVLLTATGLAVLAGIGYLSRKPEEAENN